MPKPLDTAVVIIAIRRIPPYSFSVMPSVKARSGRSSFITREKFVFIASHIIRIRIPMIPPVIMETVLIVFCDSSFERGTRTPAEVIVLKLA